MKKIFLMLALAIFAVSCSVSDDEGTQFFIAPLQDVTMPTAYKVDSISKIVIRYKRPTVCHLFNGFYVASNQFNRDVAVRFVKVQQNDCTSDDTVYEVPLDFQPTVAGTYHFKFWTGRNLDGTDVYTEYDAVVPQ